MDAPIATLDDLIWLRDLARAQDERGWHRSARAVQHALEEIARLQTRVRELEHDVFIARNMPTQG